MNKTLTNKQIALMVFSCIIGYGIISLPKDFAKNFGTSGWILIVFGNMAILLCASIYIYLAKTFNNKTIFDYSQILIGKPITYILVLMISIYAIATSSIIARLSSETIKISFLINTPSWALSLLMTLIAFYTLTKGLKVLGRICVIFGIIIIVATLIIQLGISTQGTLLNIQPFVSLSDLDKIFESLPTIVFPFMGLEILLVIPMDIQHHNRKILRSIFLIIILIGILYMITIEVCISVMGVNSIVHYEDAFLATIRRIEIDALQFLKRLDSIFIIAWILAIYTTIVTYLYMAFYLISNIFMKMNRTIVLLIITLLSFIMSLLPKTMDSIKILIEYISYIGVVVLLIIPIVLFVITLIKKHYHKV